MASTIKQPTSDGIAPRGPTCEIARLPGRDDPTEGFIGFKIHLHDATDAYGKLARDGLQRLGFVSLQSLELRPEL